MNFASNTYFTAIMTMVLRSTTFLLKKELRLEFKTSPGSRQSQQRKDPGHRGINKPKTPPFSAYLHATDIPFQVNHLHALFFQET